MHDCDEKGTPLKWLPPDVIEDEYTLPGRQGLALEVTGSIKAEDVLDVRS